MKKIYRKPSIICEEFNPDEFFSACYTINANLYCAIPGSSKKYVNDGTSVQWGNDGYQHGGPCATNVAGNLKGLNGSFTGTEAGGNALWGCTIGTEVSGINAAVSTNIGTAATELDAGYYKASWTSEDAAGLKYQHYGIAHITKAETKPGFPNHS